MNNGVITMESIKELYKIGFGPSSSHTMGPSNAAATLKELYPEANKYEITLFNSLYLTGTGHMTNEAILNVLDTETVLFEYLLDNTKHPNAMNFKLFVDDTLILDEAVLSVGGGKIVFETILPSKNSSIYNKTTFDDIKSYCLQNNLSLYDYVLKKEGPNINIFLSEIWSVMKESIHNGLNKTGVLPGDLQVPRKAKFLYEQKNKSKSPELEEKRLVSAYAFAVSEENASLGKIVTSPTCGACGVLPAVLYYMQQKHKFSDQKIIEALAVAGLIGNLIKHNASISGAVAGCQAEIGSACSMASGGLAHLFGLTVEQIEYAAEVGMEHHLGLTCDPINGYVQIPCIERNAVAALRAIDAFGIAYFLTDYQKISFDTVVKTMFQTGLDMNEKYKETSQGGLAKYYDKKCW